MEMDSKIGMQQPIQLPPLLGKKKIDVMKPIALQAFTKRTRQMLKKELPKQNDLGNIS